MKITKHFFLPFCLILIYCSVCLAQETIKARVAGVVDGDTITVVTKENRQLMIHLADIDAPEKDQEFGGNAYQFLSNLISNQTVVVSNVKKDCLDRLTANVSFNSKDLSLLAVKSGNAWADTSCRNNEALLKEESAAKEKKFGLWENPNAVKPSDFLKIKQPEQRAGISQRENRRIFSGLAPTPPPILTPEGKPSGIYIGMSADDFTDICGAGEKSSLYSSEGYQSFDIKIAPTKDNTSKGCAGSFSFNKSGGNSEFKLSSSSQVGQ